MHRQKTDEEQDFFEYVKKNERYINADFSLRLENIISNLSNLKEKDSLEEQRLKVSEYLHGTTIKELRNYLGEILQTKEKVTILIDNLDKSWHDNAELEKLSEFLFGLLNVTHKITEEFQKKFDSLSRCNIYKRNIKSLIKVRGVMIVSFLLNPFFSKQHIPCFTATSRKQIYPRMQT